LLFPRSSISQKKYHLTNSVGVIDSGYRGEVMFKFKPTMIFTNNAVSIEGSEFEYMVGDRIGQVIIIPHPEIEFLESDELSETDRGMGGYGSTGN